MKIDTTIYNNFINNLEILASYILDDGTYAYGNAMRIFTNITVDESIDILNNFLKIVKNFCTFTNFKINNGKLSDEYYENFLLLWQDKYYEINVFYNINNKEIRYLIKLSKDNNYQYIPVINMDNIIAFTINMIKILTNDERKR